MKIQALYDPGAAMPLEDGVILQYPFYGVLDGVSGLYDPAHGPRLFNGLSGGQAVIKIISKEFAAAEISDAIEDVLIRANKKLKEFTLKERISSQPDLMPGAQVAFAKISDRNIEILQLGDAFATWVMRDGKIHTTQNQNYLYENAQLGMLNKLLRKYAGDRKKTWKEYLPYSAMMRRKNANKKDGYAVFNGQARVQKLWKEFSIPMREILLLLLYTDGMVTFKESKNEQKMGETVVGAYKRGGLDALLARIRRIEESAKSARHVDRAEATAVSLLFG